MNEESDSTLRTAPLDPTELLALLARTGEQLENRLGEAFAAVGLSVAKWSAIDHLAQAGEPLALRELAERLTCVRSNVTQLVDRLEAEDLVRRVPDPGDRRSVRAELTAEGQRRHQAGQEVMQRFVRQAFAEYSPEEQRLLIGLLRRLHDRR